MIFQILHFLIPRTVYVEQAQCKYIVCILNIITMKKVHMM